MCKEQNSHCISTILYNLSKSWLRSLYIWTTELHIIDYHNPTWQLSVHVEDHKMLAGSTITWIRNQRVWVWLTDGLPAESSNRWVPLSFSLCRISSSSLVLFPVSTLLHVLLCRTALCPSFCLRHALCCCLHFMVAQCVWSHWECLAL